MKRTIDRDIYEFILIFFKLLISIILSIVILFLLLKLLFYLLNALFTSPIHRFSVENTQAFLSDILLAFVFIELFSHISQLTVI